MTNREFAAFLNAKGLKSPEGEDYYDWDDADARIRRVAQIFRPDPMFENHPARPYPYRKDDGREAPDPKATRVVRGASHDDGPDGLRVTIRRYYEHSGTARGHHHVGFRCSR